jgi:hypothetical protein
MLSEVWLLNFLRWFFIFHVLSCHDCVLFCFYLIDLFFKTLIMFDYFVVLHFCEQWYYICDLGICKLLYTGSTQASRGRQFEKWKVYGLNQNVSIECAAAPAV